MFRERRVPVLLLKNKGLVKTVKFNKKKSKYVGDPINAVRIFNDFKANVWATSGGNNLNIFKKKFNLCS